ncbi:hypothetical protein [Pseudomonas sp. CFBP 13602]|uniref:hypothetical protein n=1 Tax=Pseudomonas sp. CFBP 13602 TaxID=2774039 RepID=UPI00177EB9DE|nr:hypothetical protein [Pseudomonas sp. CFBP 13602]MBD8829011.1 hypothetical protein [Pseudomonas sp. CFBP 13602]
MKDQMKPHQMGTPLKVMMLAVAVVAVCVVAIAIHRGVAPDPVEPIAEQGVMDFGFINLASSGCVLRGPNGESVKEKLMSSEQGETVIIPEGTRIEGDCFLHKKDDKPYKINGGS